MAKKKDAKAPENKMDNEVDVFVGGEEDDLMDMEYIHDETTSTKVETMPPSTKEEADALAEIEAAQAAADAALKEGEEVAEELTKDDDEVSDDAPVVEAEEPAAEDVEGEAAELKIPKDRFDEVNDRMKTAEETVKSLKEQLEHVVEEKNAPPPEEPYDYATKEKEAMDALLEGDSNKYAEIRSEIRQAEKDETLREAKALAEQGDASLKDSFTFEEAGAAIEAEFPQFAEDSESYNKDAREDLIDLYLGYSKSGTYTRVQALQRAAAQAAKMHNLAETVAEDDPVPDNVVDIKKTNVKEKVAADNAQPPAMEGRADGQNEEPRTDVMSMSDEEFDALPESSKRRLRGDVM